MRFILMGQVENITKSLRREDFRQELLFADARPELQGKHLHLETPEDGCLYEGDILSPEESLKQSYDFIVIFADQGMVQIYRWLYANGVPFGRVLRYPQFLPIHWPVSYMIFRWCRKSIRSLSRRRSGRCWMQTGIS